MSKLLILPIFKMFMLQILSNALSSYIDSSSIKGFEPKFNNLVVHPLCITLKNV